MSKKIFVGCLAGLGGLLLLGVLVGAFVFLNIPGQNDVIDARQACNSFLTLLRDQKYEQAYPMLSPEIQQQEIKSPEALGQFIQTYKVQIVDWTHTGYKTNFSFLHGGRIDFMGTATYTEDRTGTFAAGLMKVGGKWRVVEFDLRYAVKLP